MSGLCYREVIMIFLCPLAGLSGNTPDIKVRIRLFHPIAPVCRFSPYGVKKRLIVHILHKWHVPWILRRQWHTKPASDQTVCLWSPCPIRLWWHVPRCLPIDCIHLLIHCRRTVPRQCLPHQFRMWKAVCWLKSRWGGGNGITVMWNNVPLRIACVNGRFEYLYALAGKLGPLHATDQFFGFSWKHGTANYFNSSSSSRLLYMIFWK